MPRPPVLHPPRTVNRHGTLSPGSCERMVIDCIPAAGCGGHSSDAMVTIAWTVRVMNLHSSPFGHCEPSRTGVFAALRVGAAVLDFFFGLAMRQFSPGNGDQVTE